MNSEKLKVLIQGYENIITLKDKTIQTLQEDAVQATKNTHKVIAELHDQNARLIRSQLQTVSIIAYEHQRALNVKDEEIANLRKVIEKQNGTVRSIVHLKSVIKARNAELDHLKAKIEDADIPSISHLKDIVQQKANEIDTLMKDLKTVPPHVQIVGEASNGGTGRCRDDRDDGCVDESNSEIKVTREEIKVSHKDTATVRLPSVKSTESM
jgi:myosin heavy subunit